MANYNCATTANWFKVKDEQKFRDLMARVYATDGEIEVATMEHDGQTLFSFGCYGSICGLRNANADDDDDCDESAYDEFISGLQECVAEDDAIVIFESGHEKLRYVNGFCEVITAQEYKVANLHNMAKELASSMLGNPEFAIIV